MIKSLIFSLSLAVIATSAFASPNACVDIFKHARIEIQNDALAENRFNVSRNLTHYSAHFPFHATLEAHISALPPHSHWVDMGAGKANALMEGLAKNVMLKGSAIAFKKPSDAADGSKAPGRFEYLDGEYVENMAAEGRLDHLRGRVQLLTDLYGPLSYSENLPKLMQVYVDLLSRGGVAYVNIMSERNYDGKSHVVTPVQAINAIDGNAHGFIEWLRTIPGIQVVETAPYQVNGSAVWEKSDAIKIVKLVDEVAVPHTIETVAYEASSPPTRAFRSVRENAQPHAAGF